MSDYLIDGVRSEGSVGLVETLHTEFDSLALDSGLTLGSADHRLRDLRPAQRGSLQRHPHPARPLRRRARRRVPSGRRQAGVVGHDDRARAGVRHRPVLRHLLQRHRRLQGQHRARAASTRPPASRTGCAFPWSPSRDMVRAQKLLIDSPGHRAAAGRVPAARWAACRRWTGLTAYPEMVASCIPIATTHRHSPMQIAFNEVGRQAIMARPQLARGRLLRRRLRRTRAWRWPA